MKKRLASAGYVQFTFGLVVLLWLSSMGAQAQPTVCSGTDPGGQPATNGLYAEYFRGYFEDDPGFFSDNNRPAGLIRTEANVSFATTAAFGDLRPVSDGTATDPDRFSLRLRGSLSIATAGEYTFYLTADDAAYLWLDGEALALPPAVGTALIDNGGRHSSQTRSATLTLSAGRHNVLLLYGEDCCDNVLVWEYEGPGLTRQVVPTAALCTALAPAPLSPRAIRYEPASRALPTGTTRSSGVPTVEDGGAAVTGFALANAAGLPAGISIDAGTGVLTAAASVPEGTYDLEVAVSNAAGTSRFRNAFRFQVTAPLPGGCGGPDPGGNPPSAGLYAEYFSGYFDDDLAFFAGSPGGLTRTEGLVNFPDNDSFGALAGVAGGLASNPDEFSLRLRGSLYLAATADYTFYLTADDAAYLWLDNAALAPTPRRSEATIDNGGSHPARTVAVTLRLGAGLHNVLLLYGDQTLNNTLVLEYESAALGLARQVVPGRLFCTSVQPLEPLPTALTYSPSLLRMVVGNSTTSSAPTVVSASQVVEYELDNAAALPAGITINAGTGRVSVDASVPEASYTLSVAARNAGGDSVFVNTLTAQVVARAPAGCSGLDAGGQPASSGLFAEFFPGYFNDDPAFFTTTPAARSRNVQVLDFESVASWGDLSGAATGPPDNPETFSARFRGRIRINTAGTYTFYLTADDGAFLWLDNAALAATPNVAAALIQNGGQHPATTESATISLSAGLHDVLVLYGENTAFSSLKLEYASPDAGVPRQLVAAADLCSAASNAPLPVTLTRFGVEARPAGVLASWETAQELNSARFVIERSANGQVFEAAGQVAAAGTTSQHQQYTFLDTAPLPGLSYYRLRQLDLDGSAHFSGVVTTRWNGAAAPAVRLSVFPNPVGKSELMVRVEQATAAATTLEVLDLAGRRVLRQQLPGSTRQEQTLDLRALPAGVYLVRLLSPGGVTTQRLVRE
ncbi:T9SS type A sorting domain-containing protein [Hymenobacter sp. NST-14]|uniref:PA14 domain-containing protein n=1 Tax=Hymenobacter piscis TaxID=2839984 RepID=UPI001C033568|nr:PA14 domain-containing protein [Hymenobacter piscis]MBT9393082.1 T9SS type A sorting domain-containing protein [Hymenobacter piscis]